MKVERTSKIRNTKTKDETAAQRASRKNAHEYNTSFLARSAEEALYDGIPISVAMQIFKIDETALRTMVETSGIEPCGKHGNGYLYTIYDLASLVVPPRWTEEEWEDVLSRRHFPAQLTKEFWGSKKARIDYLSAAGDLWHTDEVAGTIGDIFKTFAMAIKLIPDNLDRETALTETQRAQVNQFVDDALAGVKKLIDDKFSKRVHKEKVQRFENLTGELILDGKEKASELQTGKSGKVAGVEQKSETEDGSQGIADL